MKAMVYVWMVCVMTVALPAQCKVYSGSGGYRVAARVADGRVYAGP